MGEANLLGSPAPNLGVSPQFQLGHLESRPVFPEKDHEVEAFSSRFPMDNLEKWPVSAERGRPATNALELVEVRVSTVRDTVDKRCPILS